MAVIAGDIALRTAAGENVRRAGSALAVVDGVGPGIRERTGQAPSHALLQLSDKSVVPTVHTRVDDVDAGVAGIDPVGAYVNRRGIRARLVSTGVIDAVGYRRTRRANIDVIHRGEVQTPAPDIGNRQGHILGELAFDRDVTLLRIGRAEVFGCDIQVDRTWRRIVGAGISRQDQGEHRARSLIARGSGIECNRLLIDTVAQNQGVDQSTRIASIKNAVAGANYCLTLIVKRVSQSYARSEFLVVGRDPPGSRIIRIGHGRLGQV